MKNDIFHCAKTDYTVSLSRCALFLFFVLNFSLFTFHSHAQGVTKNGKITATGTDFVNINGKILSSQAISKNGNFLCPANMTINHLAAGGVAPVDKTVTYGVVKTGLSGASKCWITKNLGSTNQASSATDATEASSGWYWQFNRKQGYKIADDGTTRTPNTSWDGTDDNTYTGWDPAKDPCTIELGTGWRIPTSTEWTNADATGAWNYYADTYNSVLKLHDAGYVYYSLGSLHRGTDWSNSTGCYWTSTQSNATLGRLLYIDYSSSHMSNAHNKAYGGTLRCLRD